jgi:putative selenate reductase
MGDRMRPVPFEELVERIFSEYRNHGTIFGIHKEDFFKPSGKHSINVFGQKCATPLGPAAGPHTQLAQNIVSAYMVGGRFMELKTVQIMDHLEIAKPCIDARDEGHNVEWSTEYTLEKAYDEYLKAWFAVHLIQAAFTGKAEDPDFIFNMSVGYNLEGIKQPKMQTYIDNMIDATKSPLFEQYKASLKNIIEEGTILEGTDLEGHAKALKGLENRISANISPSVTISTMHGCPPKEIEAICSYMLTEKKLNTFVKLNPTLLGYDEVRRILDLTGFNHVGLRRESFEHDLQYPDAVAMLHRLVELAKKQGLGFGVKLTNTLGNINDGKVLPGEEKYMSGRALLPISTTVATRLSAEFNGKLPISYSGGCTIYSVQDIFDTGIRPITLATDMLKPGGYARMARMAEKLDKESKTWGKTDIDPKAVEDLAMNARNAFYSQREFRGERQAKVNDDLPMFDCYVSPCMEACPIHQNIPDYVGLVGDGRYAEALTLIYEGNALPNITCNICDHQCQFHCARMDYEGAVHIRDMKKIAVEKGTAEYLQSWEAPEAPADVKAAVVGAGPAGLAAGYFLARAGFDTTLFEKEANSGGVVANIIPNFRIDPKAIQADIDHVAAHGVKFKFNAKMEDVTIDALKKAGYDFIYYAIGSEKSNEMKIEGDTSKVIGALSFLAGFKADPALMNLGKHVIVAGGGNTAMDSARAAKRVAGVEDVTIVYRRTAKEMPADPEEVKMAADEGIKFMFLVNPMKVENGKVTCVQMVLGEPDASGRRRPVETNETVELPCDTLLTAIGEHPDKDVLNVFGVPVTDRGIPAIDPETNETKVKGVYAIGDVLGASTVVKCIASARKAVEATIDKVFEEIKESEIADDNEPELVEEYEEEEEDEGYLEAEERFFKDVQERKTHLCEKCKSFESCKNIADFAQQEAKRCMDCTYYCNKCVEVCPNRANVAIDMRSSENTDDPFQILHLDAFCNECGNCAAFCNHQGRPYKDKFTLFSRHDDFDDSTNSGFLVENEDVLVRVDGKVVKCSIDGEGNLVGDVPALVKDLIEQVFISYDYLLTRVEE